MIKYQMVLVSKVDSTSRQKLLPSEYNFESRVLSIVFQIHYLRRDIGPGKPRHTSFADNFLSISIWVARTVVPPKAMNCAGACVGLFGIYQLITGTVPV